MRFEVPEQIGSYRVLEEMGGSGLTRWYRVEKDDPDFPQRKLQFALKTMLHLDLADAEVQQRMRREASISVRHPNVRGTYDWGVMEGGRVFQVVELLDGDTLDLVIDREAPMAWHRTRFLAAQILSGLQALHEAGIIHRQLRPSNIIVTAEDCPKITNFLLSRRLDEFPITTTGTSLGDVRDFTSPQLMADAKRAHVTDDLFSLGAMVYQMLTRHLPFEAATNAETVSRLMAGDMTPLLDWRPELSPEVDRWVSILLAKSRTHRYQTAMQAFQSIPR